MHAGNGHCEQPGREPAQDQRASERVRLDTSPGAVSGGNPGTFLQALVKASNTGREFIFKTRDLSLQGVFLYTPVAMSYPLDVGSELQIELYTSEQYANCRGVIVRVVEPGTREAESYPTGFGVRLIDMDEQSRTWLRGIVERTAVH